MADAVLVMAALLLRMPNMLLLARTVASFALSWECPDMYVNAPRPRKVAVPARIVSIEWFGLAMAGGGSGLTNYSTRRAVLELRSVLLLRCSRRGFLRHICNAPRERQTSLCRPVSKSRLLHVKSLDTTRQHASAGHPCRRASSPSQLPAKTRPTNSNPTTTRLAHGFQVTLA